MPAILSAVSTEVDQTEQAELMLFLGAILKMIVVASVLMGAVAYLIYVERKVAAYAQDRLGPNRAGREIGVPFGLLQPLADGAKMLLKEGIVPTYVNKPLYVLAPLIAIIAALDRLLQSCPSAQPDLTSSSISRSLPTSTSASSTSSPSAAWPFTAIILAGWSSNNKYSFIGGLRSSAQLISYEIPLGLSILGVVLCRKLARPQRDHQLAGSARLGSHRLADRVPHLPGQRVRRDQPAAVRPSRIGARAGRRFSHRVFGE